MEKTGNLGWKIKWFALFVLESSRKHGLCFQRCNNFIFYTLHSLQQVIWILTLRRCVCTVYCVFDVAALQFVGRSISVFLTFNILLCTVYLCWTWLHCSCWSLNIGAFSNYLTVNQFYLFLCLQHSHLHTPSLPTLRTIQWRLGNPFIRNSIPHL